MASIIDLALRKRLGLEHRTILIIDETRYGLKIVADMCHMLGVGSVIPSKSTESGLAVLSGALIDLVVCDWGTPPLDGLSFARSVRASENGQAKQVPIILIKSQPTPPDVIAAREAGGTEFLARPFAPKALFDHLATIFSKPREFVIAPTFNGPDRRRRVETERTPSRRAADRTQP